MKSAAVSDDKAIRVLYAEDSTIDADLTLNHFKYEAPEFAIDIAGTGEEFLQRLKEGSYDVLLLDYRLPDMDGIDLLKELAALGVKLPIVMVTGTGDEELVVKILRFGTSDYVPKTANYLATLPTILKNAIIDFRSRQESGQPPETLRYHILYIEHSPFDLDLTIRHFAEVAPYLAVEGMGNSDEALRLLSGVHDFDLVLMDLRMPDVPGLEFMHRLKQLGIDLPVILITGKGDEDTAVATLKLGAYDYIVKRDNYLTQLPYAIENAITRFQLNNANTRLYSELVELNRSLEEKVDLRTAELQQEVIERRRIEEALLKSEQKYRSIFENAMVGIFQSTPDGRLLSANPALALIHGFTSPEEMLAVIKDVRTSLYVNPDDRNIYMELLEKGDTVVGFEARFYRSSKDVIWVSMNIGAYRNEHGEVLYYEGIVEDITSRKLAEESLQNSLEKARSSLAGTIQAMALIVETRDPYTAGHQRMVSSLARAIAEEMGLSSDAVDTIRMASVIHDIGKMSVPAEILSKPTKLSDIEFGLIKVHPQSGYDILKDVELPYPLAEMVLQHHERLDGSGYPQGLKDGEILLEAQIMSVADVVEAMASHRPYRPSLGIDTALEEIEKNKGVLYNPEVVEICVRLFRENGFKFV